MTTERYDLNAILAEVAEDEAMAAGRPKDQRVSQDYIKEIMARKKKGEAK